MTKAIDQGDYNAVVKAVNEGDEKIIEAESPDLHPSSFFLLPIIGGCSCP